MLPCWALCDSDRNYRCTENYDLCSFNVTENKVSVNGREYCFSFLYLLFPTYREFPIKEL